jgi:hypothetical protein
VSFGSFFPRPSCDMNIPRPQTPIRHPSPADLRAGRREKSNRLASPGW